MLNMQEIVIVWLLPLYSLEKKQSENGSSDANQGKDHPQYG